jgi:hypothetical protein
LASIPWIILVLPGSRSYQYYKLLQSLWPLTVLVAFWLSEDRVPKGLGSIFGTRALAIATSLVLGTFFLIDFKILSVEAKGVSARSGMNGVLHSKNYRTIVNRCRTLNVSRLYIVNVPGSSWTDSVLTGWLAYDLSRYFHKIQIEPLVVADLVAPAPTATQIPRKAADPSYSPLQDDFFNNLSDVAVLQVGATFLRPDKTLFERLYSDGPYQLYRPLGRDWFFIDRIGMVNGEAIQFGDTRVIVGSGPANYLGLNVESSAERPSVMLRIEADRLGGNSSDLQWNWHIYSDNGYGCVIPVRSEFTNLETGPIRRGCTQVYLGPFADGDDPRIPKRPLKVAIKAISYSVKQ